MKPLFTAIVILFTAAQIHAQLYPGITVAYQMSNLKDSHGKSRGTHTNGFRTGGFIEWPLIKEQFGIRLEASYSFINIRDTSSTAHLKLHYLSTPLYFFYKPNRQLQLLLGPQLNTLLKQKGLSIYGLGDAGKLDPFDFGIQGSIDMFFARQWSASFRYYQGLKYNSKYQFDTGNTISYNRIGSISLAVNYIIRNDIEKKKTE